MTGNRPTSVEATTSRPMAFGDYRFDSGAGRLWRGDAEVKLTPRVLGLLALLAERPTEIVTKQELIDRLWDGKAVGDDALTACVQKLRRALDDDPRNPRFVETRHRRGYRLIVPTAVASSGEPVTESAPALALQDRPSIAVLPFRNLSGHDGQQYFIDGLGEDIIDALSRIRWLFVIARNSSFTFRDGDVDVKRVGQQLGVRYVLEGSVRKSRDRIRITGQLVEAATRVHLWSEHFEGGIEDVFELQDQMTSRIVGSLMPRLDRAEIERALHKPTQRLDAYDLVLRGRASLHSMTKPAVEDALALFLRAIELDPKSAVAHARAAVCYAVRRGGRWGVITPADIDEANRLARRAWMLDQNDAIAVGTAGFALALGVRELESGAAYLDHAIALNPNAAIVWGWSGWINVWSGRSNRAIEHFQRAMRLSPLDRGFAGWETAVAHAHYMAGRYEEASVWAERGLRRPPDTHEGLRIAAAAAAMAGRLADAGKLCARLRTFDPRLSLSNLGDVMGPYRDPKHPALYAEGLRRAGLPA